MYVYDGSTWRAPTAVWAYDGATWRKITTGWVYDGATWRKFLEPCTATLDSAVQNMGGDGADGCSSPFCTRCVEWSYTDAGTPQHIRILRSVNGGSYFEEVDDLAVNNGCGGTSVCSRTLGNDEGCYSAGCWRDTTSTQFKVRLEADGGDSLACGDSGNEITTGSKSGCAVV